MLVGGADELGAVLIRAEGGGGEVASSWSSMSLAFMIAAEAEYSETSSEGGRHKSASLGGGESNL